MLENQRTKTKRQFTICDLLFFTATFACTISALSGSPVGLSLSLAFFLYWTPRPLRAMTLLRISFGALAGYCIAHTFFSGSFPFGPSPSTENLCIMIGSAATFKTMSATVTPDDTLRELKMHEPCIGPKPRVLCFGN